MTGTDLPLDNSMRVQWEFANEERFGKRNALCRRLMTRAHLATQVPELAAPVA